MITILVALIGIINWIQNLKNRIVILETLNSVQKEEIEHIHTRITKTQQEGKDSKAETDESIKGLVKQIHEVEKNIIRTIENSKK